MKLTPARRISGRLSLPGDKSISHRAAIIASLARGASKIENYSTGADCASTLACLQQLGVSIRRDGGTLFIDGAGESGFHASSQPLDCGNSGSTMRLLAGVLASKNITSILTGDRSLRSRPMKRIIEPLTLMGARINSEDGKPPLTIEGTNSLQPISYELPVASAQVKSAILLAALNTKGCTELIEFPTRDHTERMLQWNGVALRTTEARNNRNQIQLDGPAVLNGRAITIPGDISSAAYFLAGAALLLNSELELVNLGLNPTRTEFLGTLRTFGAQVEVTNTSALCNEPRGTLRLSNKGTHSVSDSLCLRGALIPKIIDELPLIAVVGTQIPGGLEIRDASELRVKECDRISATVANLRAMGAEVFEYEDGLKVKGPISLQGTQINSYGDHRIAMAFSIAALIANGDSKLIGAECVAISFPEFFDLLESVIER